jgi:hypothetical protein
MKTIIEIFLNRHTFACLQIHVAHLALRGEAFGCLKPRRIPARLGKEKGKGEEKALAAGALAERLIGTRGN